MYIKQLPVKNKTSEYYKKLKEDLSSLEPYSYSETKSRLLENDLYRKYYGKAKNRTFIKDSPQLYQSVLYHTELLEQVFKEQKSYKSNYNLTRRLEFIVLYNCNIERLKCHCGKTYNWTTYCRYCPEPKKNQLGKPHTRETKRKMRLSTLKYLENLKGQLAPRYNKDSIELIEEYGKANGYKFMHAENGDFKKLAHISHNNNKITYYDKKLPTQIKSYIETLAKNHKGS